MPDITNERLQLDDIDWSFPGAGGISGTIHASHWFPGNFIPQLPAALIQILSREGDTIFDPFCGSGTTVIEAAKLDRVAIGSDRISACVSLAAQKSIAARSPLSLETRNFIIKELAWDHICESNKIGRNGEGAAEDLPRWFHPKTLRQLKFLWGLIEATGGNDQKILELIFSDILFSCASTNRSSTSTGKKRRHHWGWVADNVVPKDLIPHNALSYFRDRVSKFPNKSEIKHDKESSIYLIQQDARELSLASSSIDVVITSPPYVGMIDYTRANRLLYLWMGWALDYERSLEIGARYKRGRKACLDEYLREMGACWKELHRVLKPQGFCALIIGESRKFPGAVKETVKELEGWMPIYWGPVDRKVSRRRLSDRNASEMVEQVCVFRKP